MTNEPSKNAVERMIDVMAEVGSIGKSRNAPGLAYAFRGIDDITPVVQPLFVKHGLILTMRILSREREIVTTSKGAAMVSVRLEVEHTFRAPDGSTVVTSALGEALDQMDKASNKAMTAALKATLTTSFTIPVNDPLADTEASEQVELTPKTPATPDQTSQVAPRPAQAPSGAVFPGYGSMKGKPLSAGTVKDLSWYAGNCRRNIADPSKAQWAGRETATLAAIEAELRGRGV